MRFMRAKAITSPPSRGIAPPDSPVPAPRPTKGTPNSCASLTSAATSLFGPIIASALFDRGAQHFREIPPHCSPKLVGSISLLSSYTVKVLDQRVEFQPEVLGIGV